MKSLKSLLLLVPVLIYSCGYEDDVTITETPEKQPGVYLTGIKQSLSYEFSSPNGRVVSSEDQVTNLAVYILSANGEIAYEQHYYPYYEGEVPDTIFIPDLGAGDYELMATTANYYNYYHWDFEYDSPEDSMNYVYDTTDMVMQMVIPANAVSDGPIYAGYQTFALGEDEVFVNVDMENVSAKVTLKVTNGTAMNDAGMEMNMHAPDAWSYDMRSGEFVDQGYDNYIYSWVDSYSDGRTIYVMPQSFQSMTVYYYQYYSGANFNQTYEFDEPIALQTGDAITFTLDVEALLDGAGNSVFKFEDIDWNDLGEMTIP